MASRVTTASIDDVSSRCFEYFAQLPGLAEDETRLKIWRGQFDEDPNEEADRPVLQLCFTLLDQILDALVNIFVATQIEIDAHNVEEFSEAGAEGSTNVLTEDLLNHAIEPDPGDDHFERSDDLDSVENDLEHSDGDDWLQNSDEESHVSEDVRGSGGESDNDSLWGLPDANDDIVGYTRLLHENTTQLLRLCQAPTRYWAESGPRYNAGSLAIRESLLDALQAQEVMVQQVPNELIEAEDSEPKIGDLVLKDEEKLPNIAGEPCTAGDFPKDSSQAARTKRPCPIFACEHHSKGFARERQRHRHILMHCKGVMVCGFCPDRHRKNQGFGRTDGFKRHLISAHGAVEKPPKIQFKIRSSTAKGHIKEEGGVTGTCSACDITFADAQGLYEHLDDCMRGIVQHFEAALEAGRVVSTEGAYEAIGDTYLEACELAGKIKVNNNAGKITAPSLDVFLAQVHQNLCQEYMRGVEKFGAAFVKGFPEHTTELRPEARYLRENLVDPLRASASDSTDKDTRELYFVAEAARDRVLEILHRLLEKLLDSQPSTIGQSRVTGASLASDTGSKPSGDRGARYNTENHTAPEKPDIRRMKLEPAELDTIAAYSSASSTNFPASTKPSSYAFSEPKRETMKQEHEDKPENRPWTEISKDLIVSEALAESNYEWEETDQFFYLFERLSFEDIHRLEDRTKYINRKRRATERYLEWERRKPPTEYLEFIKLLPPLPEKDTSKVRRERNAGLSSPILPAKNFGPGC